MKTRLRGVDPAGTDSKKARGRGADAHNKHHHQNHHNVAALFRLAPREIERDQPFKYRVGESYDLLVK